MCISKTAISEILTLAAFLATTFHALADTTPRFVVFTYAGAPSTTLTVNWQTKAELSWMPAVHYSTSPQDGLPASSFQTAHGSSSQIDGLKSRFFHRVHLTGLTPNTTYYLSLSDVDGKPLKGAPEFKLRTIPDDETPLRFVTGGDMGTSEDVRTLLRHAASWDPDFAVVGGDVAYANGQLENAHLWDKWLTYYTEEMITSDGYTIPLLVGVGNHETHGMFEKTFEDAPYLPALFGQDMQKNHFSRRFGKNLALLMLDSNHTASHESQVTWIRQELRKFQDARFSAAVYHVPLYPSHRDFMEIHSELGREHWGPVFDEMKLTVAFENHDHTHKRTHLIKGGEISTDGTGTLFLGDGCWGRSSRAISYGGRWYLKEVTSSQHFWCVNVSSTGMVYRAVNMMNQVFDVYPEDHPEAAAAAKIRGNLQNKYMLPSECSSSAGYIVKGDTWEGGSTTIKVTNTLEFPMTYTVRPALKGKDIAASGFSDKEHTLAPGSSKEHEVRFTPMSPKPLARRKVKAGYAIHAEFDPPGEKPIKVQGSYSIPVRSAK